MEEQQQPRTGAAKPIHAPDFPDITKAGTVQNPKTRRQRAIAGLALNVFTIPGFGTIYAGSKLAGLLQIAVEAVVIVGSIQLKAITSSQAILIHFANALAGIGIPLYYYLRAKPEPSDAEQDGQADQQPPRP
ncbi:hypothetical protein HYS54_02375 [Candidatus Micrarchaeota archaeon]|nr:hypothetical protein [Candidatus Micrarchaeota archaeon]